MVNSRDINDLIPEAKAKVEAFLTKAKSEGIDIILTSTFRDFESQASLYNQGPHP